MEIVEKPKLVAPTIDELLRCFKRGWENASPQTVAVRKMLDSLFGTLSELAPIESNEEVKTIWLKVPRGNLDDFGNYDELVEYGDVSSRKEFVDLWTREYPAEHSWYELVVSEHDAFRGVSVGRSCIVSARLDEDPAQFDWLEERRITLLGLLTHAAEESMKRLREGSYNAKVAESLPYQHRAGIIRRSDIWAANLEEKEAILEGLTEDVFEAFRKYVAIGAENTDDIGRLHHMTGADFLNACAIGYEACGYNLYSESGERLPLDDLYLRFADNRDEGLTGKGMGLHSGPGIDLCSSEAWEAWYFDRERHGGHPWEVCRGGNSTHVSLYVLNDRRGDELHDHLGEVDDEQLRKAEDSWGFYYLVAGDAWSRAVESVNFYVALKRTGLPVALQNADAILARFEGADFVGIVPHDVFPAYCEIMFPERFGTILDFIHVYDDDLAAFGDKIEWLPTAKAKLADK